MAGPIDFPPLGIGLAGLGRAGTFHLERISLRDDCQVLTAYDPSAEATGKAAGLVSHSAPGWHDLLADRQVELVLLATPPASHAPLTIEALAAGKHVLVETPLAITLTEADAVLTAARRAGRSVIVAQTRRWENEFRTVLNETRGLGRLQIIKHINWHYEPIAPSGNQQREHSKHSFQPQSIPWRDDPLKGGGPLWEFGVHDFDQLLQIAGESPTEISAELYRERGDSGTEIGFLAIMRFSSGLIAHLEVHHAAAFPLQTGWIVVGSEGSTADDRSFTVASDGEVVDVPLSPVADDAAAFHTAVVAHLRGKAPNPVPPEQARDTIAMIEAVRTSAQTGRPASVER
jgi:predicted dehydrogenase